MPIAVLFYGNCNVCPICLIPFTRYLWLKYALKSTANFLFDGKSIRVIFALSVTIYEIFTVEIYLTLTFRLSQGQM